MYLLDTHTLLWYLNDSEQLSDTARNLINCEKNISVSIVSFWEIALKKNLGKLNFSCSITEIENLCLKKNINILSIKSTHLDELANLPPIHNDPFDRLIIAQAKIENLILITKDKIIPKYEIIKVLWS
ncbi:MAG: type II toxin-antitoxin system VapC family toxin [Candidatus Riflebacteria bacterium]|nr:type II toxin-antitoxin system VapC family toxin [Candidatus Riflebacteria bacterium]